MELFKNTQIDFLGKWRLYIGASLVLTAVGLASWIGKGGLKYGIDFTGGSNVTVKFATAPPVDKIRSLVSAKIGGEISVQEIPGQNAVIIGTPMKDELQLTAERKTLTDILATNFGGTAGKLDFNTASEQTLADALREPLQQAGAAMNEGELREAARAALAFKNTPPRSGILTSLDQLNGLAGVPEKMLAVMKQQLALGSFSVIGAEVVGPKIGAELRTKAVMATMYSLAGMLVYLWFRFEFIYGLAAVIAVFHDVVITLGLFSLFGKEISLNVVAALLTLVGYSMNDTIVVFDRIRENLKLSRRELNEQVVNDSINQTLSRTVMVSGLTFVSAVSLLIFGGAVLNGFAFALVAGIIVGTYSSIFVASPILVFWHNFNQRRKRARATAGK